jgi:hypothetical protein
MGSEGADLGKDTGAHSLFLCSAILASFPWVAASCPLSQAQPQRSLVCSAEGLSCAGTSTFFRASFNTLTHTYLLEPIHLSLSLSLSFSLSLSLSLSLSYSPSLTQQVAACASSPVRSRALSHRSPTRLRPNARTIAVSSWHPGRSRMKSCGGRLSSTTTTQL